MYNCVGNARFCWAVRLLFLFFIFRDSFKLAETSQNTSVKYNKCLTSAQSSMLWLCCRCSRTTKYERKEAVKINVLNRKKINCLLFRFESIIPILQAVKQIIYILFTRILASSIHEVLLCIVLHQSHMRGSL